MMKSKTNLSALRGDLYQKTEWVCSYKHPEKTIGLLIS